MQRCRQNRYADFFLTVGSILMTSENRQRKLLKTEHIWSKMDVSRRRKLKKIMFLMVLQKQYVNFLKMCRLQYEKKKTRVWRRFIYTEHERDVHGFFNQLFLHIKNEDSEQFRKATRMGVNEFQLLARLLEKRIAKQDFIRESIPAECRLAITLVYLGQGVCRQMLAWSFRVGVSTVAKIILETSTAIWDELSCIYLAQPNEDKWKKISDEFYVKTGMPHVVGAIDGKHVHIKCPPKTGSLYYNYKQFFSIVILAVCDSNYIFTAVDIGAYGSQSDGGILKSSGFGKQILDGTINIPKPARLPNSNIEFQHYFIGDAAFPLKTNTMRPYPGKILSADKENFNKNLSRARVRIENTFGILAAKWRVLTNQLNVLPENAQTIVMATIILHNFVKFHDSKNYCPPNYVDHFSVTGDIIEGNWREEVEPLQQSMLFRVSNTSRNAFASRDLLKDYFLETGASL